jgi:DNA-binding CsgD family transcriptional regulator
MDDFDPLGLMDLIGHIYEAAADPNHWDEFLGALEQIYPDSRITLFGHEPGHPTRAFAARKNYRDDDLRAYVQHHVKTSPFIARVHKVPIGRPSHSEEMITDGELEKTEYYNEYMRPRRLGHYATGMVLERSPARLVALSIADHRNDADRRAHQFRLVQIIGPHLMRAMRLYRALSTQKTSADAAQAALDRWAHAALVLNAAGGVVSVNRAAEVLLKLSDGLRLDREGRLRCADETRTRALDLAIRKCAAIATTAAAEVAPTDLDGIVLPRPSGASPLRAMMWPLPFLGGTGTSEFGAGTVLLVLFDPDQVPRTPVGWLAQQFGLTPSEQRLAEVIINGVPLADAAEQLGIQLSTARQRLKIIQTKTDCHRQVDLVRLAMSLPALRQEETLRDRPPGQPAGAKKQDQSETGEQRGGDHGKHGQRAGGLEQRQQCEWDQRRGDPVDAPGGRADRGADAGRKRLRRVDVESHDIDRADQVEGDAGRNQRQRRAARGKGKPKQRH